MASTVEEYATTAREYAISAVRFGLVLGGIGLVAAALHVLLTIPPAPPDSDGFVTGMAYLVWGFVLVVSLGVAGLGVALPAVLGTDDSLGFNDYQRSILKLAGGCLVGGLAVGVGLTIAVALEAGLILWIVATLLGVLGVAVALAWRLGEVVRDRLAHVGKGGS